MIRCHCGALFETFQHFALHLKKAMRPWRRHWPCHRLTDQK